MSNPLKYITKNFTWAEAACRRTGLVRITDRFWRHMVTLQELREWWGEALDCWGYRTPFHNANEGGAGDSQHLLFFETTPDEDDRFATDIHLTGFGTHDATSISEAIDQFAAKAKELGFTGIGKYDWGLHLDMRDKPYEWDYREAA